MKEFYITDKPGNYIEDIDEVVNNSLDEIKSCYQFRNVKSFKYMITAECDYKKRTIDEVKTTKIFSITDYINKIAIYEYGDFKRPCYAILSTPELSMSVKNVMKNLGIK